MTTQTVQAALQAIPPGHQAYALAQRALGLYTLAASTKNTAHAQGAQRDLRALIPQIVDALVTSGDYPAPSVLAAFTLRSADCGITGTMNVATVSGTPGVY